MMNKPDPVPLQESLWKALKFAQERHRGQRYGPHPYTYHLCAVRSVAFEFGILFPDVLIATVLHDVLEDTETTRAEVLLLFGSSVARLVWAVTNESGKNRKERAIKTYPKIVKNSKAVLLKLCDRIANGRECWREADGRQGGKNQSLLGMYRTEYGAFRKGLRSVTFDDLPGEVPHHVLAVPALWVPHHMSVELALWNELDRLMSWGP